MVIDFNKHKNELFNPLIYKLQDANTRFVLNMGGAGSGKSHTQTQHEIIKCLSSKERLFVIRKIASTLNNSVISVFLKILNQFGLQRFYEYSISNRTIEFTNGSKIIFLGMDDPEKIKSIDSPTRQWVEEATELSLSDFKQLNLRLRGSENLQMTLTFNPIDEEHWINQTLVKNSEIKDRVTLIKTTYLDNKFIDEAYKLELESYKLIDKNYYRIYALGEWGGLTEGRIFEIWKRQSEFPTDIQHWYGLDFGYSNDPTAIVKTVKISNKIYVEELCYRTGMTNSDIASIIKEAGYNGQFVICDSAEPKSIEELRRFGINAIPAIKGQGSIMSGIDYLKRHEVIICGDSPNIVKENRYYQWKELPISRQTNTKKFENTPKDAFNHCFNENTMVETIDGLKKIKYITNDDLILTTNGYEKIKTNGITGRYKVFVYKIKLSNFEITLECTNNHLIYTSKGWVQISKIEAGMKIFLSKNLTERNIDCIKEKDISLVDGKGYTLRSGNSTTEKLKMDLISIIKMATRGIMIFQILKLSRGQFIDQITVKRELKTTLSFLKSFKIKGLKWLLNGINQQKVKNGILNTQIDSISGEIHMEKNDASYAEMNLHQKQNIKYSAQINAKANSEEIQGLTILQRNVSIAEANLHRPNIQNKNVVQEAVVLKVEEKFKSYQYTWDITMEKTNEFFANGILVHNCIDAFRYSYSHINIQEKQNEDLTLDIFDL